MTSYLENIFSLKGKTAIVTGASSGIGAEIAKGLLYAGANVVGISRSKNSKDKEFPKENYFSCDILKSEDFQKICVQTKKKFGSLNILVNAAGITQSVLKNSDKFKIFYQTIKTNLISTYQCSELASHYMMKGGSIINITSIASNLGFPDNPGYVASKGGLQSMTRALAIDYAKKDIRVNNLVPGYTYTKMTKDSYKNPKKNQRRLDRMVLKRWGSTKDFIGSSIFLASDASSYITGADIIVDGGWTIKGL